MEEINEKVFVEQLIEATKQGKLKWRLSSGTLMSFETKFNGFRVSFEKSGISGHHWILLEEQSRLVGIGGNDDLKKTLFDLVYEPWRESQRKKDAAERADLLSRATRFLARLIQ